MHISYKDVFKTLLISVFLNVSIFSQGPPDLFPQNQSTFQWRNPLPSGNDYLSSFHLPGGRIMATGEGGYFYDITYNEKWILEHHLDADVIDAVYDSGKKEYLVLVNDGYCGLTRLIRVSVNDLTNSIISSWQIDKKFFSFDLKANIITLAGKGGIKVSTDYTTFNDITINGGVTYTGIKYTQSGRGILIGNNNSILYSDDMWMTVKPSNLLWNNEINFEKIKDPEWNFYYTPGKKSSQNDTLFVLGFQPATNSDVVCRSTDDGSTWDSVFAAPTAFMTAISVGRSSNIIIGGYGGVIYYSKDGGDTWKKSNSKIKETVSSVLHVSVDSAYAFGTNGIILLTTDGGVNWTQISGDISTSFSGIYFSSSSVGYAVGLSGESFNMLKVYKTTDAGDNWKVIYTDSSFSPSYASLNSVLFLDDMTGFIAGSKLLKTTDGGMTWNELNTGVSSISIFEDICFVNSNLGFAVGRDPFTGDGAIKTTDGGNTWSNVNINNNKYDKKYVYFVDENLGFISGYSRLYRTTDGGDSWDTLSVGTDSDNVNSRVTFVNASTGFFGKRGIVYKTTDKGDTWTEAAIDSSCSPQRIQFVSDSTGYLITYPLTYGTPVHVLYKTKDGGKSWHNITNGFPGTTSFNSMYFTDDSTGYLAGPHGKIIKTTSGGEVVTAVSSPDFAASRPSGFKLYQNYPNPFNPVTKIRYSIPTVQTHGYASVQLEIFDLLGRKIATLVNKKQLPGEYEVEFDASRLSSGVYFYRLSTYNKHITKKLVLLK